MISTLGVARENDGGSLRALCQTCHGSGEKDPKKACVLVTIYRRESDLFALLLRENRDFCPGSGKAGRGRGSGGLVVLCDMTLDDTVNLEVQSMPLTVKVFNTCDPTGYFLEFGRNIDLETFQRAFASARGYFRQMLTLRTLVADSFWQGFASAADGPVRTEPHRPNCSALEPAPGGPGQPALGLRGRATGRGAFGAAAELLAGEVALFPYEAGNSSGSGGQNGGASGQASSSSRGYGGKAPSRSPGALSKALAALSKSPSCSSRSSASSGGARTGRRRSSAASASADNLGNGLIAWPGGVDSLGTGTGPGSRETFLRGMRKYAKLCSGPTPWVWPALEGPVDKAANRRFNLRWIEMGRVCHRCRYGVDRKEPRMTCPNGRNHAFCVKCLKNAFTVDEGQLRDGSKLWRCPLCEGFCPCAKCVRIRDVVLKNSNDSLNIPAEGGDSGSGNGTVEAKSDTTTAASAANGVGSKRGLGTPSDEASSGGGGGNCNGHSVETPDANGSSTTRKSSNGSGNGSSNEAVNGDSGGHKANGNQDVSGYKSGSTVDKHAVNGTYGTCTGRSKDAGDGAPAAAAAATADRGGKSAGAKSKDATTKKASGGAERRAGPAAADENASGQPRSRADARPDGVDALIQEVPPPKLTHYEGLFTKYLQSLPLLDRLPMTEDVCFLCKEGGNLVECDEGTDWSRRVKAKYAATGKPEPAPGEPYPSLGVPEDAGEGGGDAGDGRSGCGGCGGGGGFSQCKKVYHAYCMGFLLGDDELGSCPRHACLVCGRRAEYFCRFCPVSLCAEHYRTDPSQVVGETGASMLSRARNPYRRSRSSSRISVTDSGNRRRALSPRSDSSRQGDGSRSPLRPRMCRPSRGCRDKSGRSRSSDAEGGVHDEGRDGGAETTNPKGDGSDAGGRAGNSTADALPLATRRQKRNFAATVSAGDVDEEPGSTRSRSARGATRAAAHGVGAGADKKEPISGFEGAEFVCRMCKMAARRAVRQYGLLGSLETGGLVLPYGESDDSGNESESEAEEDQRCLEEGGRQAQPPPPPKASGDTGQRGAEEGSPTPVPTEESSALPDKKKGRLSASPLPREASPSPTPRCAGDPATAKPDSGEGSSARATRRPAARKAAAGVEGSGGGGRDRGSDGVRARGEATRKRKLRRDEGAGGGGGDGPGSAPVFEMVSPSVVRVPVRSATPAALSGHVTSTRS